MRFFILILLLFSSFAVQAETRFITDELLVPLRSSPCGRCAIIHQGIKSGTALEVIELGKGEQEGWAHVRTRSGLQGWLPSQYLVAEQVARVRIEAVENKLNALQQENQTLNQALTETRQQAAQLEAELQSLSEQNTDIDSELRRIKQVSANALNLERQHQELLKRNGMLQNEIDVLTATNQRLQRRDSQTWFLYGSMSVALGALLTVLLPRLKRRKRFSEWA